MGNVNRWKYGDTDPVVAVCREGTAIEIGDLVYQATSNVLFDVRPASAIPNQGSLVANQEYFACRFLGHASQQHRANQDPADFCELRVGTRGSYEYPCQALTRRLPLGTFFGPEADAAGTGLRNQMVAEVAEERQAVGRLARIANVGDTTVLIRLVSEVMEGGLELGTCSGSSSSGE